MQRRVHLGFQYVEETDPSRFTRSKISELELKDRVARLLKNVVGEVSITGSFGAGRRPREVLLRVVDRSLIRILLSSSRVNLVSFMQINPKNYQSMPPLPKGAPLAHTDSSVNLTAFAFLFC